MKKSEYIEIVKSRLTNEVSKELMINQINTFYDIRKNYILKENKYKIGDEVILSKGTLLHGTYKNLNGLKKISRFGVISSWFIDGRVSKYPSAVSMWKLKEEYRLRDYINLYSGGTISFNDLQKNGEFTPETKTQLISYEDMPKILDIAKENPCRLWYMEQTKEARFMPSLCQDTVQIGIIFDGENELLKGDVLNPKIPNEDVREFVNPGFYERFMKERNNKDDFFTDRESAILFGLPPCLIQGVLVGRQYEKDEKILKEIKELLPYAYICNLDGIVIM